MRFISLLLLPLLLAACESGPKPGEAIVFYSCDDGTNLRVLFSDRQAKVTLLPGKDELVLPLQPTGSGVAYATAQYELRGKGEEATWAVGRRAAVRCLLVK